jgi:hypothetical protein
MASSSAANGAQTPIGHEGVVNMTINQDSVNQLMEGAQSIEAASASVNEGTGIEAIKMIMRTMALVIRVLVRLCVDVSTHMGNFEAIVESKIQLLQGQSQETIEAAKKGYEAITTQVNKQAMEVAKVLTNAGDSFNQMKQEMQAIKTTSNAELQAIQKAIKRIEEDIQNNGGNMGGIRSGNSWRSKSAMEHKAIANLKTLGSDRQGYRQWHDKFVNAMAQVNKEYRTIMQTIVKAIENEEKLPIGDIDEWESWFSEKGEEALDLAAVNEDLFSVLMDKTESEAYFRVKSVEPGNGIEAFVKIVKWFMGTSGLGLQRKSQADNVANRAKVRRRHCRGSRKMVRRTASHFGA